MYGTEFFYPFIIGTNGVSFIILALSNLAEVVMLILLAAHIKKTPCNVLAMRLARFEFALHPISAFSILSLSAIFPLAARDWLYFTNMAVTGVIILARLAAMILFQREIKNGQTGLLPIRNHIYVGFSFCFIVLNYYALSILKSLNMDFSLISETGQFAGLNEWFLAVTVVEIAVGILVLLQAMFMSFANYYSGKENQVVDMRLNLQFTKRIIAEHDIPFWIGVFANFLMLTMAIMSMFSSPAAYAPIVALYAFVLLFRVPGYLWQKRAKRVHGDEPRRAFISQHRPFIVAAFLFVAYGLICVFFGRMTFERMGDTDYTYFLTFGIFVPWAIIKIILGIREYLIARKTGDPLRLMNAYIDLLVSAYTISHAFLIVAGKTQLFALEIVAMVTTLLISVFCLYLALRMLVLGILGLNGKRDKTFDLYQRSMKGE